MDELLESGKVVFLIDSISISQQHLGLKINDMKQNILFFFFFFKIKIASGCDFGLGLLNNTPQ